MSTFTYQPLTSPKSIRLLILEPAADPNAPLHAILEHTTLEDQDQELTTPYSALSYVWGNPADTSTITLSSHTVTITATLASALTSLRSTTHPRRIWADALCIDQSNIPERNSQVQLMGLIYSIAHSTIIYLGPSTPESTTVLSSAPRRSLGLTPQLSESTKVAVIKAATDDILLRPWFRRVWIFQELVLSRDPWVQCGSQRVRWGDFCHWLLHGTVTPQLQLLHDMNRAWQGTVATQGTRSWGSLLSLLQSRRGLGATDPRDFVFAHMGVCSDADVAQGYVPVDYSVSVGRVFAQTSGYILNGRGGVQRWLSLLDDEAGQEKKNGVPSWAVDWSIPPGGTSPMYKDNLLSRAVMEAPNGWAEGENTIGLVGYTVGVIDGLGVEMPLSDRIDWSQTASYQTTVGKIGALYASTGGVYYSGDAMGRYAHVSLKSRDAGDRSEGHHRLCLELSKEWLSLLHRVAADLGHRPEDQAEFNCHFMDWVEAQSHERRIWVTSEGSGLFRIMWEYLHLGVKTSALHGRRLAMMTGSHFGVVPAKAQRGDLVVNVVGSNLSLVLRHVPVGDKVQLDIDDTLNQRLGAVHIPTKSNVDRKGASRETTHFAVEHHVLVGACYFDGQVPWALSQLPEDESSMRIYALH